MTTPLNNRDRDATYGLPANTDLLESMEEIEAFGRDYFAEEFANPQRLGCPPRERLLAIARSIATPDSVLREHLFTCSDCLREFRSAAAAKEVVSTAWWRRLFSAPRSLAMPALGALAGLVVIFVVAFFVVRQTRRGHIYTGGGNQGKVANQAPTASPDQNVLSRVPETTPAGGPPSASPNSNASPRELLAMTDVRVDLRQYNTSDPTRDASGNGSGRAIRLASSRMRIQLTLGDRNSPGSYVVAILDRAYLKPLTSAHATSSDGRKLAVSLNGEVLRPGHYLLSIAREGEAPSYYPLVIPIRERNDQ